jgi:hypothetical protein
MGICKQKLNERAILAKRYHHGAESGRIRRLPKKQGYSNFLAVSLFFWQYHFVSCDEEFIFYEMVTRPGLS